MRKTGKTGNGAGTRFGLCFRPCLRPWGSVRVESGAFLEFSFPHSPIPSFPGPAALPGIQRMETLVFYIPFYLQSIPNFCTALIPLTASQPFLCFCSLWGCSAPLHQSKAAKKSSKTTFFSAPGGSLALTQHLSCFWGGDLMLQLGLQLNFKLFDENKIIRNAQAGNCID